jgi:transcriptional regulator with XRE-family HTH domain
MTAAQCRAARELLGWTREDLARAAGLSIFTIRSFEQSQSTPEPATTTLIQRAFEGAGVRFQPPGPNDLGVSLTKEGP